MNCRVCGSSLFPGRAVFNCSCGAFTHAYCWEKHVLESHEPPFAVGTISMDDEFSPNKIEVEEVIELVEGVIETAEGVIETAEGASEAAEVASELTGEVSETAEVASEPAEVASESAEVASESAEVASEAAEVASELVEEKLVDDEENLE